jgi:SAM-dependent methyltransferase
VTAAFAGETASHYRRYRRDLPAAVLDRLVGDVGLTDRSLAIDVGAGTGQVAVPLAARAGTVLAAEPEPDMLALLRQRGEDDGVRNLLCVLASDRELPTLLDGVSRGTCGLVTVANALHWMDAPALFGAAHHGLAPGGALAVITHGIPLWLADTAWARAVRDHLTGWFGRPVTARCGSDEAALHERRDQLTAAGFGDVVVWEHRYRAELDTDHVVGHLYSALSEDVLPMPRRPEFEDGLRCALHPYRTEPMHEDVPVTVLLGRR